VRGPYLPDVNFWSGNGRVDKSLRDARCGAYHVIPALEFTGGKALVCPCCVNEASSGVFNVSGSSPGIAFARIVVRKGRG
jgi:hypothetical protein